MEMGYREIKDQQNFLVVCKTVMLHLRTNSYGLHRESVGSGKVVTSPVLIVVPLMESPIHYLAIRVLSAA